MKNDDFFTNLELENENVYYINTNKDSTFKIEDFYDDTHLNEVGTKKLTIILNTKINSIIQNNKNLDT